jgi:choline dehydrogenase-like flavoprotein
MFDYIIIGAGSAGCVLASRLTEDPACRVLLLEAGGEDDSPLIRTPAFYGQLQDSPYDWAYRTIPQAHMNGRRIFVPQGRVLGGSSAINFMIYIRGNRGDYDQWCYSGNDGWAYDDVLPYFVRAEGNQAIFNRYHGNRTLSLCAISPPRKKWGSRSTRTSTASFRKGAAPCRQHSRTAPDAVPLVRTCIRRARVRI